MCRRPCQTPLGGCPGQYGCDSDTGICRPACDPFVDGGGVCPGGYSCRQGGSGTFCMLSQTAGDGGVGDGGACLLGNCQMQRLTSIGGGADSIALGIASVYWSDPTQNKLYGCDRTNGCNQPATLMTLKGGGLNHVAVVPGSEQVVWYNTLDQTLRMCSPTNCESTQQQLVTNLSAMSLGADGQSIYVGRSDGLYRCPVAGCSALVAFGPASPPVMAIATDGTNVFWSTCTDPSSNGTVYGCSQGSFCSTPNVIANSPSCPASIVGYATDVFWREPSFIRRCPKGGCSGPPPQVTTTQLGGSQGLTERLAVNLHGIFWDLDNLLHGCQYPDCSGGGQSMAGLGSVPPALVADDQGVFFLGNGGLYRLWW